MANLDIKFVAAACPELTASECEALLAHCRDITRSDNDIYPDMLRATSRSLFPDIDRRPIPSPLAPDLSPKSMALLNKFRMEEAISDLKAANFWLGKVSDPSDTVGMAIRDIGIIADQLQGVKQ